MGDQAAPGDAAPHWVQCLRRAAGPRERVRLRGERWESSCRGNGEGRAAGRERGGVASYREDEGGGDIPSATSARQRRQSRRGVAAGAYLAACVASCSRGFGQNSVRGDGIREREEENVSGSEYLTMSSSRPVHSGESCLGQKTQPQYSAQMQSFNT
jgi:hypothetical protein